MLSRSGGIFAAISDQVLAQGGVIYGAGMDEKFNVVHKRATNEREREMNLEDQSMCRVT